MCTGHFPPPSPRLPPHPTPRPPLPHIPRGQIRAESATSRGHPIPTSLPSKPTFPVVKSLPSRDPSIRPRPPRTQLSGRTAKGPAGVRGPLPYSRAPSPTTDSWRHAETPSDLPILLASHTLPLRPHELRERHADRQKPGGSGSSPTECRNIWKHLRGIVHAQKEPQATNSRNPVQRDHKLPDFIPITVLARDWRISETFSLQQFRDSGRGVVASVCSTGFFQYLKEIVSQTLCFLNAKRPKEAKM